FMAANKGGDTKNGLIIALVCFVLLSIALGVTAYYGYADNANDRAKAKEAEGKATTMAKNRDWYKYLYLEFRKASGHGLPKDENDLKQLSGAVTGEEKADLDKVLQDLKDKLVREKGKDSTAEYYADKVARLDKELQAAKNE